MMSKYDHLTREELIERLEKAEISETTKLQDRLDGEKRIARALILMLKNYNSNYEEEIMRIVLERFQADRAFLFRFNWENNTNSNIYEVNSPGISSEILNLQNLPNEALGDYLEQFRKGIPLIVNDVTQMSETAYQGPHNVKQVFQMLNLKSAILFPMHIFGELWGFVGMETVRDYRTWNEDEIEWLKAFTNILSLGVSQRFFRTKASDNERRFNDLFENMPIAYVRHRVICDENNTPVNYRYIAANPAFELYTGLSREKCIGKTLLDMGVSLNPKIMGIYQEVAFQGKQKQFDYFSPVLNKWFYSVLYSPQYGEFISLFYDVTDRIQATERIKQNEKKIRIILENLPISVVSFDSNGKFVDCNEVAAKTFKRLQDPNRNRDLNLSPEQYKILNDQKVFPLEFTFQPESQQMLTIKNNIIPPGALFLSSRTVKYTDERNNCLGYLFIAIDNTDIKKTNLELENAQKALTENIVRLSLILETGQIYPWYMDYETGNLDISEEFYKAFGQEKKKKDVQTIRNFIRQIHPDDQEKFREEFQKLQNSEKKRIKIELRLNLFHKGYIWCELNAAVRTRGKMSKITKCLGFLTIIQQRKDNEQQLIEAMRKARESDKLKSAFLANVSHEIRTPLNAIVGFSELIANTTDEEDKKNYLEIVKTNNNLLLNLINDILDLSKIESGRIDLKETAVNMHHLCRELCLVHQMRAKAGVRVIFENPDQPLTLLTDEKRIMQIYSNLIGNAIKNTFNGTISVGYCLKGNTLEGYVRDTGLGIPKEKQELIFNRFEKLNSNHQGFGLGLSICKSILEKMGGSISLTSEEGKGSEFRFQFPYKAAEPTCQEEKTVKKAVIPLCPTLQATLLIAEDIDCNYELLKATLGKSFKLLRAKTGIEAVEIFNTAHPDLILMDMKMPGLDGMEATQIIRQVSPHVPIIALTAFAYDSDKEKALEAGCNDFITKPVDIHELIKLLQKYSLYV